VIGNLANYNITKQLGFIANIKETPSPVIVSGIHIYDVYRNILSNYKAQSFQQTQPLGAIETSRFTFKPKD
jgi:hypothetical protein